MKKIIFSLTVFCYPLFVYFGLEILEAQYIAILFALIFVIRHLINKKSTNNIPHLNFIFITIIILLSYSALTNSAMALKFYPVVMSCCFLFIFGYSLYKPPTIIQLIASLREKLDEKAVIYTRKVTKVWCVFFILNATIATWTIYQDNAQIWVLYNGFLSYIAMGLLMGGEWLIRQKVKNKNL